MSGTFRPGSRHEPGLWGREARPSGAPPAQQRAPYPAPGWQPAPGSQPTPAPRPGWQPSAPPPPGWQPAAGPTAGQQPGQQPPPAAQGPARRPATDGEAGEYRRVVDENERFAETFDRARLGPVPLSGLAIITCMDARIDLGEALGIRAGDAHVIRNAGGLATDDAIRSLILSQQLLGTDEVLLIQHTRCGLSEFDEPTLKERLRRETGRGLDIAFGAFDDLEASVRLQVHRLRTHPWLRPVPVHGLIYDVETGRIREVDPPR